MTIETLRVAIVSDTHGFLDPRIADLVKTCDLAVHAGDILSARVLEQLNALCERVVAVAGNNDLPALWPSEEAAVAATLPHVATLDLPGGRLAVEHGDRLGSKPCHAQLRQSHPESRAVVYGHTHQLVCDQDGSPWVLNPGAAGRIRTHGGPSCLILTASTQDWSVEARRFA